MARQRSILPQPPCPAGPERGRIVPTRSVTAVQPCHSPADSPAKMNRPIMKKRQILAARLALVTLTLASCAPRTAGFPQVGDDVSPARRVPSRWLHAPAGRSNRLYAGEPRPE